MSKANRLRDATRTVWRRSYETARARPQWEHAAPAVDALLADLRRLTSEDALQAAYWAPGDAPGETLRRQLSIDLQPDELLELEEACFWLRLRELCAEGGG